MQKGNALVNLSGGAVTLSFNTEINSGVGGILNGIFLKYRKIPTAKITII